MSKFQVPTPPRSTQTCVCSWGIKIKYQTSTGIEPPQPGFDLESFDHWTKCLAGFIPNPQVLHPSSTLRGHLTGVPFQYKQQFNSAPVSDLELPGWHNYQNKMPCGIRFGPFIISSSNPITVHLAFYLQAIKYQGVDIIDCTLLPNLWP